MLIQLLKLMRPSQWTKNIFILLALFFGQYMTDVQRLSQCLVAIAGFSLLASSLYCLNDIFDKEEDRLHPVKRNRPLASGAVTTPTAIIMVLMLFTAGVAIMIIGKMNKYVLLFSLLYYAMNIAYAVYLKHFAIVDVFIISMGFVIRVLIGGAAANVHLSHWIITMTFLLSLFLAFAKRRDDVLILNETNIKVRRNVDRYNLNFLNTLLAITGTIVIVAYIMYSISADVIARFHNDNIYVTSLFVIAGIFRYLQLTLVDEKSSNPTDILLKDRFIQGCIFCWLASFIFIIYL